MTALGIALLVAGIALFVAEAHLPTFGLLAVAGVVIVVLGVLVLFDSEDVTAPVIIVTCVLVAGLLTLGVQRGLRASREPVRTGYEEMLGSTAEVRTTLDPLGHVFIMGALWRAKVADGTDPQRPGDRVTVQAVDGLTLQVSPAGTDVNDQGDS